MQPEKQKAKRPGYAARKPSTDEFLANLQDAARASVDFLKTDLETALIFSGIALSTEDPDKKNRMRQNARKAYDTVTRLMTRLELSDADAQIISGYLRRLRSELTSLGEELP